MAEEFNESHKAVLMDDYDFSEEDIERLESLDMDKDEMFSEIMALLAEEALSPEGVITYIEDMINREAEPEPELPQQGGRRRKGKSRRSRKGKSRKSRRGKSRRSRRSRKGKSKKR
jgi:hypothetical protein